MSNRETRCAAARRNLQNRRLRSQRARLVDRKLGSNRKTALPEEILVQSDNSSGWPEIGFESQKAPSEPQNALPTKEDPGAGRLHLDEIPHPTTTPTAY